MKTNRKISARNLAPEFENSKSKSLHEILQNDLPALCHGELSPLRRAALRLHLSRCAECREEMKIMQKINEALVSSEAIQNETPEKLDGVLREKILLSLPAAPDAIGSDIKISAPRRSPVAMWGAIAATACVACAIIYPNFSRSRDNARVASVQSDMKKSDLGVSRKRGQEPLADAAAASAPPPAGPVAGAIQTDSKAVTKRQQLSTPGVAGTRHLDGSNFSFVDGHVKWIKPKKAERFARSQEAKLADKTQTFTKFSAADQRIAGKNPTANSFASGAMLSPYRRVHREGSLSVSVRKLEEGSDAVEELIKKSGGFVANNNLSTQSNGQKTAALEIRIPSKHFESVIKEIGALGEVKAKRVTGQDITAEVSDADEENNVVAGDLRIKLANYQRAKERAAKNKESVPADWQHRAEIRRMRIELAQVRARLELLKKMSDFASLSVQLQEQTSSPNGGGFAGDAGQTIRAAFDSLLLSARLPLNLLIYILVYSPFWLPILLAWRYFLRSDARRASGQ